MADSTSQISQAAKRIHNRDGSLSLKSHPRAIGSLLATRAPTLDSENVARGCDIVLFMGDDASDQATPGNGPNEDYARDFGVVEAITVVTRSCPSGVVVKVAEQALEAIKEGGPAVLKQQAYFVLTALQGWRGDRARQVHRSLTRYLENDSSR